MPSPTSPVAPMVAIGAARAASGDRTPAAATIANPTAPIGSWGTLPEAVKASASLTVGADKPAVAIVQTSAGRHPQFAAFELALAGKAALEGADPGVAMTFKPATGATQAGGLRAVVDGADFTQYFRGHDRAGESHVIELVADVTGPGTLPHSILVSGLIEGNQNGYGHLENAVKEATTLSTGAGNTPRAVYQAADGRYWVLDARGSHYPEPGTSMGFDEFPLMEGNTGEKVTLTPRGEPWHGEELRAVVDGAAQWRFSGDPLPPFTRDR